MAVHGCNTAKVTDAIVIALYSFVKLDELGMERRIVRRHDTHCNEARIRELERSFDSENMTNFDTIAPRNLDQTTLISLLLHSSGMRSDRSVEEGRLRRPQSKEIGKLMVKSKQYERRRHGTSGRINNGIGN
jgi:hypothetical protein